MTKHPVLASFAIAAALTLAVCGYLLATTRNVDEKPFVLYFSLLGLPFVWFLVWIVLSALSWWQDTISGKDGRSE